MLTGSCQVESQTVQENVNWCQELCPGEEPNVKEESYHDLLDQ
jgi:hypothetical protein